jgi:hypothetical protein
MDGTVVIIRQVLSSVSNVVVGARSRTRIWERRGGLPLWDLRQRRFGVVGVCRPSDVSIVRMELAPLR